MDICVKESKKMSIEKRSDNFHKASSILSFAAILLTIALFVRMETVVHDTKMIDSKFTLQIQQIKDALKEQEIIHQAREKENFDIVSGKFRKCCRERMHNIALQTSAISKQEVLTTIFRHFKGITSRYYNLD